MNKLKKALKLKPKTEKRPVHSVLIIDVHNLMHRCIHGAWKQDVTDENFTYWKYLIINQICGFVNKFKVSRVILANDYGNYWRKDIYPEYKANRVSAKSSSQVDYERFMPVADKFFADLMQTFPNMIWMNVANCEADDIIAVLTMHVIKKPITAITTDKDMYQLLKYDNYQQYNATTKKMIRCLNPVKYLDVKVVMGDKGDNITAIQERTGIVTATKLVDEGLVVLEDEAAKKLYIRNRKLIDFDYIPKNIVERIKRKYNEIETGEYDAKKTWDFLVANKLGMFLDSFQTSIDFLKPLR